MARPLRIEYPDALYHVMARGNDKQAIYQDCGDRQSFLKNLKHCVILHNLIIHGYCLMENHYHLIVETPEANLSRAMRDINGNYTQWFNAKHDRVGHLLQGRYKAHLIEKETYLLEITRYVVLNPVRAKIVKHPKQWRWSNYNETAGARRCPGWLEIDRTLSLFSNNRMEARKEYRRHVDRGIGTESPFQDIKEGIILGSPQFIDWVWQNFKEKENEKEINKSDRMISRLSLQEIFEDVVDKNDRDRMIRMARYRAAYSVSEIARHLNLHRTTVSRILNDDPECYK